MPRSRVFGSVFVLGLLAGTALLPSCGRAPRRAVASPAAPTRAAAERPNGTRAFFVPLPGPGAAAFGVDGEGRRRLLVGGLRVLEGPEGQLVTAPDYLPDRDTTRALELPSYLGEGFVFWVSSSDKTTLWRAQHWTARLEPLAALDFEVDEVTPGLDRLYVFAKGSGELVALDAATGQGVDRGPLPAAPGYVALGFRDPWFGAVEVPYRGVLVTFDAGASWHAVGDDSTLVTEPGQLLLARGRELRRLLPDGRLELQRSGAAEEPAESGSAPAVSGQSASASSPGVLGRWPLRSALLHGFLEPLGKTAVVAHGGALARVRAEDGAVLQLKRDVLPPGAACSGLRLGDGFGLVCHDPAGSTSVFQVTEPLGVEPLLSFAEPRYVAQHGNGAISVRGPCTGTLDPRAGEPRVYCVRDAEGGEREITVRGDLGAERVVVLRDGRVALLIPPRLGAPGSSSLIDRMGRSHPTELVLPRVEPALQKLLRSGLWLDGWVEHGRDVLAGWVVGEDAYVGVRVGLDGKVRVGRPGRKIGNTVLNGPFALEVLGNGAARASSDGGFEWKEIETPPGFEAGRFPATGGDVLEQQVCSAMGCAIGGWLRLGWSTQPDGSELTAAKTPDPTTFPRQLGSRWSLSCSWTGEVVSAPSARTAPSEEGESTARPGSVSGEGGGAGRWPAFEGKPPPARRAGEQGVFNDLSSSVVKLRGYAWGPESELWPEQGRWQLRAEDRFRLSDAVWSTAESRVPWPDFVTTVQSFGQAEGGGFTNWTAMLDPEGRAGVLLLKGRGNTELFAFEEDRSITRVGDVASAGLLELAGAVKLGGRWFIGGQGRRHLFQLFEVQGSRMTPRGELPERTRPDATQGYSTRLVRSTTGDALGLWVQTHRLRGARQSWYIYPVDTATGQVLEPLELGPERLGKAPEICASDAEGWLLSGALPLTPHISLTGDDVSIANVEARLIVDAAGNICVESLAGGTSAAMPRASAAPSAAWSAEKPTVPLALRAAGSRALLRCVR